MSTWLRQPAHPREASLARTGSEEASPGVRGGGDTGAQARRVGS